MNEGYIKSTNKEEYRKRIIQLLYKAAISEYFKEKTDKSKLEQLIYKDLQVQPYLINEGVTYKEMYLLYSLRCRSHPAKGNYRTMYNGQVQCSLGCLSDENQQQIFEECKILRTNLLLKEGVKMSDIFGNFNKQKKCII